MMTFETIRTMSTEAIRNRVHELSDILNGDPCSNVWDIAYKEYGRLNAVLDERYREENQTAFDAFYAEHIEGKSWEEIEPETWDCYSDWHKDMYGFRPKHI